MELYDNKFKKTHGYEEGKGDAIDPVSLQKSFDYKKNFLKKFISINQNQIDIRLGGDRYFVTRKYDGEYAAIFHDGKETVTINRSGRIRRGIPCIEEAGILLNAAGYKQAIIPAEIYVADGTHRSRVNDLLSTFAHKEKIGDFKLAVFDILELNGEEFRPLSYGDTWQILETIFKKGKKCHPVDMQMVRSKEEVFELFTQWVQNEGSEGLVVRSNMPFVFKIKPRHSLDLVVVGFTEGTGNQKGMIRTLLLAFMPEKGKYQLSGRIGGGMPDELKKELFKTLSRKVIPSTHIETDSNYVAFQMIKPERVIEISVNDLIFETSSGAIQNAVVRLENGGYVLDSTVEGMSFIAPVYERFREDKKPDESDTRLSQINTFAFQEERETVSLPTIELSESELLYREVYKKNVGAKIMVQKYMVWKTNKDQSGEYPAYVFHYTNFSSDRMEPLQREINISESRKQIMELCHKSMEKNIKKGWEKIPDDRLQS